jgi:Na+/melibiose symporter-like transporter
MATPKSDGRERMRPIFCFIMALMSCNQCFLRLGPIPAEMGDELDRLGTGAWHDARLVAPVGNALGSSASRWQAGRIMREPAVSISFKNPWWVVVGAVAGLFVCNGPVLAFTFGVFLKPLMADMGWDRVQASFALSFGGIFSAMMVPVVGWLMDRWSIRKVALPGIAIYAVTIALLALSPKSLLGFTLLFALARAAARSTRARRESAR